MNRLLLYSMVVFSTLDSNFALQCLDSNNKAVDWFIFYKLPKLDDQPQKNLKKGLGKGLGHFYMDTNSPNFTLSPHGLNKSRDAAYFTLQQIYGAKDDDIFHAMYNDKAPESLTLRYEPLLTEHGHTKGVVAFDKKQGFWLVHSVPGYPPRKGSGYEYPLSGTTYGQSYLCVTYGSDMIEKIGTQFMYNYPDFYDSNVPDHFNETYPNMSKSVQLKKEHVTSPPWNHLVTLVSSAGQKFYSFAKFDNFEKDLYAGWLAPYFQSNLYTETWLNGRGKLNSSCSKYQVNNIILISLPNNITFTSTKDHSKWAITRTGMKWVCIGDINRQEHQELRGGGTVCFQHQGVWNNYNNAVTKYEHCPV